MAQLNNVNIFLKGKTPEDLVKLQLANNAINGIQYKYQTPMKDGSSWVVWFFADVTEWKDPTKATKQALEFAKGLTID
jgi:hypothetical protein